MREGEKEICETSSSKNLITLCLKKKRTIELQQK